MSVAALPMYDLAEVGWANDALWSGIVACARAEGLGGLPARLTRDRPAEAVYADPGLVFAQACGYDITHAFAGRLRVVATPVYAAPGAEGPAYASVLIVGEDAPAAGLGDLAGAVCAINGWGSHSGMNALRAAVAPLQRGGRFFARVRVSGSHLASVAMVAAGEADVAAIDCVTHALLARHRPGALAGTRVLGWSARAPGLPFVTRADESAATIAPLRAALRAAIAEPRLAPARDALLLAGVTVLPDDAYDRILAFEREAARAGYPVLA